MVIFLVKNSTRFVPVYFSLEEHDKLKVFWPNMKLFCTACTGLDEESDRHLLKTNFHIFGRFGIFPSLASGHIPQPMMARLATNYPANSAAPLISLSLPTDIITQAEHPCMSYHFIFAIQRASKCQSRQTWS